MTCQELRDLLPDYVCGDMVVETRETVEVHVTGCDRCGTLIQTYTHTVRVARKLPKCNLSPECLARLRKALEPHLGGGEEKA